MLAHTTYPSRTQQQQQHSFPYYHGQHHHHQQQQQQRTQLYHPQSQIQHNQQQFTQEFQPGTFTASDSAAFSATLDNIPTAAAALAATQRYHHTRPATSNSQGLNPMSSDSWMLHSQHTPRQTQRFGHQRDSSLSSVGSNTPASPYNANTTNPQIAVTDAVGDSLHDMTGASDNYTFALAKSMAMPESFYANALGSLHGHGGGGMSGHDLMGDMSTADGLPALTGSQQQRQGRLAPTSDMSAPGMSTRSRPVSVASSIGGDSPATPSFHEHEDDHRRAKNGEGPDSPVLFPLDSSPELVDDYLHFPLDDIASAVSADMPKLDRTMTDVYSDELYSPTFAITSASPSPQTHLALSPGNDLFTQRLQTANNRHLFAAQSPVSIDSRGQSPFRQGSPYASGVNEFPKVGTNQARLESAQQLRERRKAEEDVKQLQQQMARNSQQGQQQQSTPTTISPKDAVLEFSEADMDSNFPLFPSQETSSYGLGQNNGGANMNRVASQQTPSPFPSMPTTPMRSDFNFSMPSNVQIPQQYPFVSRQQSQQQLRPPQLTPSVSTFSRMSSAEASNTDGGSSNDGRIQRPDRTAADGGTNTSEKGTDKPARFNHVRGSTGVTSTPGIGLPEGAIANSQAGPHKCDRINPSTGKPCNTVFSRPYDLTRHEDTIHNARKQKVRCGLCTEEKTFSRADALTRHYRVCHPDAELPGKHRRRGGALGA
ncbi:hypothetical protein O1611_g5227 [Lasiodiplodia mahajangana]|uniref:Uncharacterized protein n=1 Tax=Lasiodiplodia mahajangana TaxID=1108764 RepID=A0ACC2JLM0_9PEZI|nr:hypothetical protein O1611_g5227 [Lasiodiplodia mahajangana]